MKKIFLSLLVAGILLLSACAEPISADLGSADESPGGSGLEASGEEQSDLVLGIGDGTYINYDYPFYDSIKKLTDVADDVFTAKVTGISFKMLDMITGFSVTEKTEERNIMLHTMYDIEVIDLYKGSKSTQVKLDGGHTNYGVAEQIEMVGGRAEDVPIARGNSEMKIGETYLFAVKRSVGGMDYSYILNDTQSILNLNNPFVNSNLSEEQKLSPEFNENYFNAYEIISSFGKDKWASFWAQWQKGNPDWEIWIDKAEAEKALTE